MRPRALSQAAVARARPRAASLRRAHDEFCAACHAATGGNPFMLSELIGELAADGSRGTAAEAARVRELAPATIRRAVLCGSPPARPGAPARAGGGGTGRRRRSADAAELVGIDGSAASEAADVLAAAGILEPGRPRRFVHPLVRNAVYADVPVPS